jgi:mevalonate kinase
MTSTRQLVATATDGVALTANQTNVLVYAARQLQSATDNLARLLAATSRRLAEAVEALNEGLRVNELGVLRSAGLDVDRAAAVRQERVDGLLALAEALGLDAAKGQGLAQRLCRPTSA